MRQRRAEEPLPSADRWLLSWSDFITLLLALFAAMYAGASVDLAKTKLLAQSVGTALGSPARDKQAPPLTPASKPSGSYKDADSDSGSESDSERIAALAAALHGAMDGIAGSDRVRIVHEAGAVGIDIDATLLFATADARLAPQAEAALSALSGVLADWPSGITVEGHTDSLPIHTPQFGSNWELSAMRAAMVARRLSEQGIAKERLSAVGRGDTRPLASNASAEGRAANRRVHLIVTLLEAVH